MAIRTDSVLVNVKVKWGGGTHGAGDLAYPETPDAVIRTSRQEGGQDPHSTHNQQGTLVSTSPFYSPSGQYPERRQGQQSQEEGRNTLLLR